MADEVVLPMVVGGCIGALGFHLLEHSSTERLIMTIVGGFVIWGIMKGKI